MARNAFDTFVPISADSVAHRNIIFDFYDLLAAVAAHGKMNGLGGRKLSRLAGWWAFEHPDDGKGFEGQWACDNDETLPSLEAAASAIHRGGALAFLQLHDAGRQSPPALIGQAARAPSSVPMPREGAPVPRAMTEREIERALRAFAEAGVPDAA